MQHPDKASGRPRTCLGPPLVRPLIITRRPGGFTASYRRPPSGRKAGLAQIVSINKPETARWSASPAAADSKSDALHDERLTAGFRDRLEPVRNAYNRRCTAASAAAEGRWDQHEGRDARLPSRRAANSRGAQAAPPGGSRTRWRSYRP